MGIARDTHGTILSPEQKLNNEYEEKPFYFKNLLLPKTWRVPHNGTWSNHESTKHPIVKPNLTLEIRKVLGMLIIYKKFYALWTSSFRNELDQLNNIMVVIFSVNEIFKDDLLGKDPEESLSSFI